jgi:hypothetical protein
MALHRPFEPAAITGDVPIRQFSLSGNATNQASGIESLVELLSELSVIRAEMAQSNKMKRQPRSHT